MSIVGSTIGSLRISCFNKNHTTGIRATKGLYYGNTWLKIEADGLRRKMELQDWKCAYCIQSLTFDTCQFDHIYPIAKGGQHSLRNVAISCVGCNRDKSSSRLKYWCRKTKRDYYEVMGHIDDINVQLEREGYRMGIISIDELQC